MLKMAVQYYPSLVALHSERPIQFGTYNTNDDVSFLENAIVELQQQNILLIQQCIERDNELQREKDTFMSEMSAIVYKKTTHYDELLKEKLQIEEELKLRNDEIATLKDIVKNHSDSIEKLNVANNEIARLKNDAVKNNNSIQKLNVANNEIAQLKNEMKVMIVDLSRARSIAATVNIVPLQKKVSVGVECSIDNDNNSIQKKIEEYEKNHSEIEKRIKTIMKEFEDEKSISNGLLKTIALKEAMLCREKDLRIDFEYLCNTMRMYLEVEMTKIEQGLKINGIDGFSAAAFTMYKGYCNGEFENILTKSISERSSIPATRPNNMNTVKEMANTIITTKKTQKKKK
jgi:hypothetical protein